MTAPRPNLSLPIEASGTLCFETPTGQRFDLFADGSRLRAELSDWSELNIPGPRSWLARRKAVVQGARLLAIMGLSMDVAVAKQRAITMGAGTRPSLVARLLRLGQVQISVASMMALFRNV